MASGELLREMLVPSLRPPGVGNCPIGLSCLLQGGAVCYPSVFCLGDVLASTHLRQMRFELLLVHGQMEVCDQG